jgi:hypothetical protein
MAWNRYAVTVKNTGSVAGDEVVQAYWTPPAGGAPPTSGGLPLCVRSRPPRLTIDSQSHIVIVNYSMPVGGGRRPPCRVQAEGS